MRRALIGVMTAALTAGLLVGAGPARATGFSPTYFPTGVGLDGSAYTLQFSGANREGTAAAIALDVALAGDATVGYPFSSPAAIQPKTDPHHLYGPGMCPTTAVLVADDTPADALAAAALRGFGNLPVTDTAGVAKAFDTSNSVLLLTESGREGATDLDAATATALNKILSKCSTIASGIVLGGTAAVPDAALKTFGGLVGDVARIAGADRFATAAQVAEATAAARPGLPTVHIYPSASSPSAAGTGGTALTGTVFLAEGQTGADALAVGAYAARGGDPILLTDSAALPSATADAVTRLAPKNVVVLGGTAAVSDAAASAAVQAAGPGTTVTRIAGANRYATSVAIAEQLFNLYPAYASTPGTFGDELFGFARDEGSASAGNHVGWPDALASAYYLAELATAKAANPQRFAPPIEKSSVVGSSSSTAIAPSGTCGGQLTSCYPNYPLLLTTGAGLAPEVDGYLKAMYPSSGSYKTGGSGSPTASDGGFGFLFGGAAAVSGADQAQIGLDLSGQTYSAASSTDLQPSLSSLPPVFTTINLTPYAASSPGVTPTLLDGGNSDPKVCALPGSMAGVAGVVALDQTGLTADAGPVSYYGTSAPYPAGSSAGACADVLKETAVPATSDTVSFYGASLSGHETASTTVAFPPSATLISGYTNGTPQGLPSPALTGPNPTSGNVFAPGSTGGTQSGTYTTTKGGFPVWIKGQTYGDGAATLSITIKRVAGQNGQDVLTWTGTLTGYGDFAKTTQIFTATITAGWVDATPVTQTPIESAINLVGTYTTATGGTGLVVLNMAPPGSGTGSPASGLEISGLA